MMKVRKAVFPAAGLGTRFLPATKAQPKEMLPLVDKPIIQYGVEEAIASGFDQNIIITGRGKRLSKITSTSATNSNRCWKQQEEGPARHRTQDLRHDPRRLRAAEGGAGPGPRRACARTGGRRPFAVLLADDVIDAKSPA